MGYDSQVQEQSDAFLLANRLGQGNNVQTVIRENFGDQSLKIKVWFVTWSLGKHLFSAHTFHHGHGSKAVARGNEISTRVQLSGDNARGCANSYAEKAVQQSCTTWCA